MCPEINYAIRGIGHLTRLRKAFQAQVPDWVPGDKDTTVVLSGYAEIGLGTAMLVAPKKHKRSIGNLLALFYILIFPGNISQWYNKINSFGLDTDKKRFIRLLFQPVLVFLARYSTR